MLRRLASIFTIIFFVIISIFFAPRVFADGETIDQIDNAATSNGGLDDALKEYCAKRSGNQMNLETWYSGKCVDDTFTGEGVGFADMVILDLAEKVSGKKDPDKTFTQSLKILFDSLKQGEESGVTDPFTTLNNARQELFAKYNGGIINQGSNLIGALFQYQPASTKSYLAHVSSNLQKHKVIQDTWAASNGVGFDAFSPFLPIWMAVRNLAYIGLVVFFIVYGFMMMFRVNLGQKTVISIQLAIPKLIVTLLIITFSYAIVGLVFDLMYVVIYFVFNYLGSQSLINNGPSWNPAKTASGLGNVGLAGSMLLNAVVAIPATTVGILNLVLGGLGLAAGTAVLFIPGINLIVGLIIAIAVIISYGKLFVKLIGAFISIVVSLIIGPIVLLGNAFPGSQAIGTWFRSIVANISVFPVTIILLMFSYMFMIQPVVGLCTDGTDILKGIFGTSNDPGSLHVCEKVFGVKSLVDIGNINITGVPLISPLGGFSGRSLLALLGVGLLLMAAKYVDIVKDALKVPPFKYGSDIMKALQTGINTNASWAKGGYQLAPDRFKNATTDKASGWMQANMGEKSLKLKEASDKLKT